MAPSRLSSQPAAASANSGPTRSATRTCTKFYGPACSLHLRKTASPGISPYCRETPKSLALINGAFTSARIVRQAPVLILATNELAVAADFKAGLDTDDRIAELCNIQSIGAAMENMILEAQERGLGTLWLGDLLFAYPELAEWTAAHDGGHGMLVAALCVGYAGEAPKARARKGFADCVTFLR